MEAKRFVLRKVAGENILVPVGNTALTFNGLVTLNESGAFLWKHMEKNRTREELVQEVLQEYEVSEELPRPACTCGKHINPAYDNSQAAVD